MKKIAKGSRKKEILSMLSTTRRKNSWLDKVQRNGIIFS